MVTDEPEGCATSNFPDFSRIPNFQRALCAKPKQNKLNCTFLLAQVVFVLQPDKISINIAKRAEETWFHAGVHLVVIN
jgi:hypothetical protein